MYMTYEYIIIILNQSYTNYYLKRQHKIGFNGF